MKKIVIALAMLVSTISFAAQNMSIEEMKAAGLSIQFPGFGIQTPIEKFCFDGTNLVANTTKEVCVKWSIHERNCLATKTIAFVDVQSTTRKENKCVKFSKHDDNCLAWEVVTSEIPQTFKVEGFKRVYHGQNDYLVLAGVNEYTIPACK